MQQYRYSTALELSSVTFGVCACSTWSADDKVSYILDRKLRDESRTLD